MLPLVFFASELLILFFLSRSVQRDLSAFLYKFTKSKRLTVYGMSILFLPGTFVHEMAHFMTALFMLVPVGEMELIPKIEGDGVRLGSVGIAKTDPVRRFLIGVAPFILGTILILTIVYLTIINSEKIIWWVYTLIGYLIFTISNTMFMSKKDMEGAWVFAGVIFFLIILIWVLGFNINLSFEVPKTISDTLTKSSQFLAIPVIIDVLVITFLRKI